ncbi:WhiB family transcriptional regulator [Streptomyces alfalfae]|uniref:WhiB family transcriptional regulator n=1 Tax=Streptomyces alfalfae TaxID=1642299 RepID=UPI002811460B|nr:WhiB family transcriptional regulator [Streptomyces alfalfae]
MIRRTPYQRATPDTPTVGDWRIRGACAVEGIDPDGMFPERSKTGLNQARALCTRCPVQTQCLLAALAEEGSRGRESRYGIRGGLTPSQRHALYRRSKNEPS